MRVLFVAARFGLYLLSLLPLRGLYLVSDLLFLLFYYFPGYRKKIVRANLKLAFSEWDSEQIRKTEKNFYRNFCDVVVEFIKIPSLSRDELLRRVQFTNPELFDDFAAKNESIIAVTSHMNNWEWGGLALSALAKQYLCLGIYKPLRDKNFDEYFREMRGRFGMELVPMKQTLRSLAKNRHRLTLTTLISDQSPLMNETEVVIPFMGTPVPVFNGAAHLAKSTGFPVIWFSMKRKKRGYYEVEIIPIPKSEDADYGITVKHVKMLEEEIRDRPAEWLWTHRRWKRAGREFGPRVVYR
jgi:Kdo2-lipid IVA lauroyltransferase/acyltransferase